VINYRKWVVLAVGSWAIISVALFNEISFAFINPYLSLTSRQRLLLLAIDIVALAMIYACFFLTGRMVLVLLRAVRWLRNNVPFVIFLLFVTFAASEVMVRWCYPGVFPGHRTTRYDNVIYEKSDYFSYELKKTLNAQLEAGTSGTQYRLRTDSEGFRVGHRDRTRPNILVLGDSTTFGFVNDEETYPAYLQSLLGNGANVYNAGVPGWGFAEYYLAYKRYAPKLEPGIVIIGIFPENDLDDMNKSSWKGKEQGELPAPPLRRWSETLYKIPLIRDSAAIEYIWWVFGKTLVDFVDNAYKRVDGQPIAQDISISILTDIARTGKGKVIFLLIPSERQLCHSVSSISKYAQAIAKIRNARVLDLFAVLKNKPGRIYVDPNHLNPTGNRYIAEELVKLIAGWKEGPVFVTHGAEGLSQK
jgi:hypothetical protein